MHQNRLLMDKKKSKKPYIPEQKWNPMTTTHILRLWSCTINNSQCYPPTWRQELSLWLCSQMDRQRHQQLN